VSSKSLMEGG